MKWCVVLGMLLLLTAACSVQVDVDNQHPDGWHTQVCTDKADTRQLYGSERSAFIKGCLECVDPTSEPPPRIQRRERCEEAATSSGYSMGSQRTFFLEGCYGCR